MADTYLQRAEDNFIFQVAKESHLLSMLKRVKPLKNIPASKTVRYVLCSCMKHIIPMIFYNKPNIIMQDFFEVCHSIWFSESHTFKSN